MTLENKIFKNLKNKNLTLATVESATGGYLSYLLTKIPGSSTIFKGSFVVYSLDSKNKLFKLPKNLLQETQGVSKEVAAYLAEKIRKKLKTNIGISVVGFAGPTAKKGIKVGTTFLAISDKERIFVTSAVIDGSRDKVRKKTAKLAAEILYQYLKTL
ncbi:MAG: CinA family protein [Candidatus Omnitrophica bacterium]|nr:CinA family protein [Candidatus Omnitrophota bacterium]MCF7894091.1 CinA family protein [Candidatus Omnitrophota bacterium]